MDSAKYLSKVKAAKPLVYHITNVVTVSDCANVTLFIGALPVMANSPREAAAMTALAQGLVINIGTLHDEQLTTMLIAGQKANELGLPVILDPVGAGATTYRTETARRLLREIRFTVVKGNAGEIATLAGLKAEVRGVESGEVDDVLGPARLLSKAVGAVVAVTGSRDAVVDQSRETWIDGGSERMRTFVGGGCVAASLVGCFVAAHPAQPYEATVAALTTYRLAAARAAARAPQGPVAFREAVYAELAALSAEAV